MASGKIHLVRHAHALHNVHNDFNIPDPALTELGRDQSEALRTAFPFSQPPSSIALVMTSPLQRAIETSLLAFSKIIDQRFYPPGSGNGVEGGVDIVLDPYLQEGDAEPANTGSPRSELIRLYPHLDVTSLAEHWEEKSGEFSPDDEAVLKRAERVRARLKAKIEELKGAPKRDIAVVTHGGFVIDLTEDDTLLLKPTGWKTFTVEEDAEGLPELVPA